MFKLFELSDDFQNDFISDNLNAIFTKDLGFFDGVKPISAIQKNVLNAVMKEKSDGKLGTVFFEKKFLVLNMNGEPNGTYVSHIIDKIFVYSVKMKATDLGFNSSFIVRDKILDNVNSFTLDRV